MTDYWPTPQYLQLLALVDFLYHALRGDSELLSLMTRDSNPDEIVASYLEHNPFRVTMVDGEPVVSLFDAELPVLACWEQSSEVVRVGPFWGERVKLGLLYVFQRHVGCSTVSPEAWGQRLSKMIWWKIREWLRVHKLEDWPNEKQTGDLLHQGQIYSIEPVGQCLRLGSDKYEGITADLEMVHTAPPWDLSTPTVLETVTHEAHVEADDIDDPPTCLVVEGEWDVTT